VGQFEMLSLRDALTARPTTLGVVDYVRVSSPLGLASPVPEASVKPGNAVWFAPASERIRTIATWIPASLQILDNFTELAAFLETSLSFYVNLTEEVQCLSGDGTGENLHGIIPQATAFSTSLLSASAGYGRIDIIGRTIQQITVAKELPPTFVVMHPADWFNMRLQKDTLGRFILGAPQTSARAMLFDLTVIPTTSISAGTFLVGSGNRQRASFATA
jgi:HK97 family phage major capsid protein